ncbi:phosphoribosylformylglycinamidine synthase subunit PurQ [Helicobacter sp. 23-1046]
MSVAILQFPGTNCEQDVAYAYKSLKENVKIIWHKCENLPDETTLVVVPGGFSYGDYLRSGAIARFSPIMRAVERFAKEGGYVLGICNGFQILCEAGLLPGALKRNENLHFIHQWQDLRVCANDNAFLCDYTLDSVISLPIAHADGSYYIDEVSAQALEQNNQILLRYQSNINGSIGCIAGVCNENKNVFGLMPHPERAIESMLGGVDGLAMLKALCENANTLHHIG